MKLIVLFILVNEASLYDFGESVYGNLDRSWNPWLQNICGKNFQSNGMPPRPSVRSIGGSKARKDEFPWTVALTTNLGYCSGVLISPRHVLTAAHCVVNINNIVCELFKYMKLDEGWKKVLHKYQPLSADKITVYTGINQYPPYPGEHHLEPIVMNITIHPNFDPCRAIHDLAILEVTPNSVTRGSPICMPTDSENIPDNLTFSGFGINPAHPNKHPLETVNLTVDWRSTQAFPHQQIVTSTPGRGLCGGDSGGPLFKRNGTRNVLVGIASGGSGCDHHTADQVRISFFEDVTKRVHWVCDHSGVCPM